MSRKKGLPAFITTNVLDNFMFGYVFGIRQNLPSTSIENAIMRFKRAFNVKDSDMNLLSAKRRYIRMNEMFIQYLQSDDDANTVD